jgi:uncharacterized membrane-anchored protein YhcB (DUF1043 family)
MRTFFIACLAVLMAGGLCRHSRAQEKTRDLKAIEAELDHFRDDLFHAFNKGDYKDMLEKYCQKDVIATWQDGTTSKGHAEVLAEFAKLKTFIEKMTANPNTDKRLILNDGKLVIASGNMKDEYTLSGKGNVSLNSRWEATLIYEEGRWVLVGFSASTDAFDNEVIDLKLKKTTYTSGGIAAAVGLLVGIVITFLVARRRSA